MLEQRQKNLQQVKSTNKKDKDEIDLLRKQMSQLREEFAQKERYNKSQVDRLQRQVTDLRAENNELKDEIAHYELKLREVADNRHQQQLEVQNNHTGIG